MELTHNSSSPVIYAVQDDKYSRCLELTLLANGSPWVIPEDAAVLIRYLKSDGKGGEYNTLPDENTAWTAEENVLTLTLAPQVLTCPGVVNLAVTLMRGQMQVSTFAILICVEPSVGAAAGGSEDYFHVPGFLPAPRDASVGQFLQVSAVDAAGHVTGLKAASIGENALVTVEPAEDDIPKVFFGAALPQTKDDTVMSFRYISRTEDISGYCKTKAQGNSSMNYPKKNQTVKLYKDAGCTEKLKVDFKGWGKQNKFCFKANWIDLTHARNIVSARLWSDVVKSRANYAAIPDLLRTSPNQGAVDGFPVKVYANGIYQGRYTINIPKDAWMANMDDELDEHCILCGENYVSGCFRAEANIDESDWTDEVHETVPESIKTRWNEAIRFVMNSTDEEFVSGIGNYFDVDSLIDYYIFGLVTCNNDGFGKNQLFFTYDGQKWIASVYDVDNTFGIYLGHVLADDFSRTAYEDYKNNEGNLLYVRLEKLFTEEIKVRYAELKNDALSLTNIINRFERFTDITPVELVKEDYATTTADGLFTDIPLKDECSIQQIRNYIAKRYTYVDKYILNLGKNGNLLYSLPGETTFDGATTIDTGVKLFDEPKDFTIIADLPSPTEATKSKRVLSCSATGPAEDGWPYLGGVELRVYPWDNDIAWSVTGTPGNGDATVFHISSAERTRMAIVFENGSPSVAYARRSIDSGVITYASQAAYTVMHNSNLVIGSNNYGADYYDGTVYSLEVWDYAMTAEEVAEKFGSLAE